MQSKGRPRIPTPDVTKEVVDRERHAVNVAHMTNQLTSGVTLMPHQLSSAYPNYPGSEVPFVQVVLSPIQELEGPNSVNSTLHPGQPGTAALAQAVLTPGLGPVITPVTSLPMTVSQLHTLGLTKVNSSPLLNKGFYQQNTSPIFQHKFSSSTPSSPVAHNKITEIATDEEIDNKSSRNSEASVSSKESDTNLSNTTASIVSKKEEDGQQLNGGTEFINLTTKTAPTSITSVHSDDGYRSRKVSTASHQNVTVGAPKRGEVYV